MTVQNKHFEMILQVFSFPHGSAFNNRLLHVLVDQSFIWCPTAHLIVRTEVKYDFGITSLQFWMPL